MARIFIYEGNEYPDPDPLGGKGEGSMTVDEVRQNMANFMPELATAETKATKRGEDDVYTFVKKVGTKG